MAGGREGDNYVYNADLANAQYTPPTAEEIAINKTIVAAFVPTNSTVNTSANLLAEMKTNQLSSQSHYLTNEIKKVEFNPTPQQALDVNWWKNHIGDDRYNAYLQWRNEVKGKYPPISSGGGFTVSVQSDSLLWNPEMPYDTNNLSLVMRPQLAGPWILNNPWKEMKAAQVAQVNETYKPFIESIRSGKLPEYIGDPAVDWFKDYFIDQYGPDLANVPSWTEMKDQEANLIKYLSGVIGCYPKMSDDLTKEMGIPEEIKKVYAVKEVSPRDVFMVPSTVESHWSWNEFANDFNKKMTQTLVNGERVYIPNHMKNWKPEEIAELHQLSKDITHEEKLEEFKQEKADSKSSIVPLLLAVGAAIAAMVGV